MAKKVVVILGMSNASSKLVDLVKGGDDGLMPLQVGYEADEEGEGRYLRLRQNEEVLMLTKFLDEHNLELVAVVNRMDEYMVLHGKLVDHFRVPGPSEKSIAMIVNKDRLHRLMTGAGLGAYRPKTRVVELSKIQSLELPWVIKPVRGVHSKGVMVLKSKEEVAKAKEFYEQNGYLLRKGLVLAEEYLDGKQLTCTAYFDHDGSLKRLSYEDVLSGRDLGQNHLQLVFRTVPSKLVTREVEKQTALVLETIGQVSGVTSTFIHPEFMIVGGKLYLMEINVRLGGFRAEMLGYAAGKDVDKMTLDLALGKKIESRTVVERSCTGVEQWGLKEGKIERIKVPESEKIVELRMKSQVGDDYLPPPKMSQSIAKYFVVDKEDSLAVAKRLYQEFEVEVI